jgi:hypothetical protein
VGFVAWFDYPGHVLAPVGNPPWAPSQQVQPLTFRNVTGQLDPFVLFKPKVSPFPLMSVELQVLLAAGFVLIVYVLVRPRNRISAYLPFEVGSLIGTGVGVALLETGAILLADAITLSPSGASSITSIDEASVTLFIFYEFVAILPVLLAFGILYSRWVSGPSQRHSATDRHSVGLRWRRDLHTSRVSLLLVASIVLVPLASGVGTSVLLMPGYITNHIDSLANVSSGDLLALKWAGTNLPDCSRVLVAPGSVGQFLPEYASISIIYPAFPTPTNLSYSMVVLELDAGNYTNTTRGLLLELGATEILVSGQNSVSFSPFQLRPLLQSSDFFVLFQGGDVTILNFLPGSLIAGCSP